MTAMQRQKLRSNLRKKFGHRNGRSSCAHSIGKFFLCYIVLFSFETSATGSPGNYLYKYIRCEGTSNNSRCSSVDFQESNPLTGVFHTNNMDNASGWSGRPSGILSSFRKIAANITSKNSKTAGKMVKCWLIISPVLIFSSNSVSSLISSTGPNAALAPCVDTCRPVAEAVYQFSSCVLGLFWTHDIGKYDLFLLQSMKKGQSNSNPVIQYLMLKRPSICSFYSCFYSENLKKPFRNCHFTTKL